MGMFGRILSRANLLCGLPVVLGTATIPKVRMTAICKVLRAHPT